MDKELDAWIGKALGKEILLTKDNVQLFISRFFPSAKFVLDPKELQSGKPLVWFEDGKEVYMGEPFSQNHVYQSLYTVAIQIAQSYASKAPHCSISRFV